MSSVRKCFLTSLPVELLYEIHIFTRNPNFPIASKHLYLIFVKASRSVKALYLLNVWTSYSTISEYLVRGGLSRVLSHPICTLETVQYCFELLRHPYHLCPPSNWKELSSQHDMEKQMSKFGLPRRLTRNLWKPESREHALVFLEYLYNLPPIYCQPLPDNHGRNGFLFLQPEKNVHSLLDAIQARCVPLVRTMLRCGADPGRLDNLPVREAIKQGDLALVKLLLEGDPEPNENLKGRIGVPYTRIVIPVDKVMLNEANKAGVMDIVQWLEKKRDSSGGDAQLMYSFAHI